MTRPIACYFGPGYAPPLYECAACGDARPRRSMWRPSFYFWISTPGAPRRALPARSRVCRKHTVSKKHRHELPALA